jgi:hypothetical protein
MSTTAQSSSSLASSSKFKAFAIVFSITGPIAYCVIQYLNWPLVTFWPATNRLVWGFEGGLTGQGPNMLWYGWTLSALIIATVLGIIAMFFPARTIDKIPLSLLWIVPILSIPYVVYSLMYWWNLAAGVH